jgi:hypothetical protein
MIRRLQDKWKVSGLRLLVILVIFATGGSLTGYLGKKVMALTGIENHWVYLPFYFILVTCIWPFMVLLVSLPLGQFPFFKTYIGNLLGKISGKKHKSLQEESHGA